jgi:N-glycosylase/DNA lyase
LEIHLDGSSPFKLDFTLCCGQSFRWEKRGDWWYGVVRDKAFKICQTADILEFENVDVAFVKTYFGLNDDLPEIFSQIGKDKQVKRAVEMFEGLRILRQDPWECLISYICATYKSIAAIKRMLLNLSQKIGEEIRFDRQSFYTFPTPEKLAKATIRQLTECGLGYRARYVSGTAKMVYESKFDFDRLKKVTSDEAKRGLLDFPGVGSKVADCILLFSLEKLEAFPVDVWVKRVILRYYASHFSSEFIERISGEEPLSKSEYEKLNLFGQNYFGKYAGYAQEYLYHYERIQH